MTKKTTKAMRENDEKLGYISAARRANAKRNIEEGKRQEKINRKANRKVKWLQNGKIARKEETVEFSK